MLPYRDSRITRIALGLFFVVVIGYAYFEARGLIYGPRILVPAEVAEVHERFVTITGRAERISELRMNGKPIAVTEEGDFEEPYLLTPGLNRIILDAEDKYGRTHQEIVRIVYTPTKDSGQTVPVAGSASSSTTTTP